VKEARTPPTQQSNDPHRYEQKYITIYLIHTVTCLSEVFFSHSFCFLICPIFLTNFQYCYCFRCTDCIGCTCSGCGTGTYRQGSTQW